MIKASTDTMELHTLVEEDENIDELPQEEETRYITIEDHVMQDTPTSWTLPDDQQVTQTEHETLNRNSIRDSLLSDNTTSSNRISAFDVSW